MKLILSKEDLEFLKGKYKSCNCLFRGWGLTWDKAYCNGECDSCDEPLTFDIWISKRTVEE